MSDFTPLCEIRHNCGHVCSDADCAERGYHYDCHEGHPCPDCVTWAEDVEEERRHVVAQLVTLDVAKWGEEERAASHRMHNNLTLGLALNSLAYYDLDKIDATLASKAKAYMTEKDLRTLRSWG